MREALPGEGAGETLDEKGVSLPGSGALPAAAPVAQGIP